eukprot:5055798-Pleurochrysis_carterae.AAC.5
MLVERWRSVCSFWRRVGHARLRARCASIWTPQTHALERARFSRRAREGLHEHARRCGTASLGHWTGAQGHWPSARHHRPEPRGVLVGHVGRHRDIHPFPVAKRRVLACA